MTRSRRLLSVIFLATIVSCHIAPRTRSAPSSVLLDVPLSTSFIERSELLFFPVTVGSQTHLPFLIDLGAGISAVSFSALKTYGIVPQQSAGTTVARGIAGAVTLPLVFLDSLTLGTAVHRNLRMQGVESMDFRGFTVAGWLGTDVLRQYVLVLDVPHHRAQLLQKSDSLQAHTWAWLPEGIKSSDCVDGTSVIDPSFIGFPLTVNGHAIPNFFDSGATETYMNWAAAEKLGFTRDSPKIRQVGGAGGVGGQAAHWEIDEPLEIAVQHRPLASGPVYIVDFLQDRPVFALGLDRTRDRMLVIRYSPRIVCLGRR